MGDDRVPFTPTLSTKTFSPSLFHKACLALPERPVSLGHKGGLMTGHCISVYKKNSMDVTSLFSKNENHLCVKYRQLKRRNYKRAIPLIQRGNKNSFDIVMKVLQ